MRADELGKVGPEFCPKFRHVKSVSGSIISSCTFVCTYRLYLREYLCSQTEYRSDGTKRVIRPARLSLARVSVLRGDGPKEGVPFIDDHIHTSEIIVDYLTEFSGIKCESLVSHICAFCGSLTTFV